LSISVTPSYLGRLQQIDGPFPRRAVLTVTGLTAGAANTIPHGLPGIPKTVGLNAGTAGLWGETQPADATNIYVTVGSGGHPSGYINVTY
jgi:hypothetical protein